MAKLTFVQPDGVRREIEALPGITLMEAARQNNVAGIIARCGGACACATCHVYVDEAWLARLPPLEDMEEGMLETTWEPRDNSRLSCQIEITPALDGLLVRIPAAQG